jgi:hypothetical protein
MSIGGPIMREFLLAAVISAVIVAAVLVAA